MGDEKPPKPVIVRGAVDARSPGGRGFLDELFAPSGSRLEAGPNAVDDWLSEELSETSIIRELSIDEAALARALQLSLSVGPDDDAFWARYHADRTAGLSEGRLLDWWKFQDQREAWATKEVVEGRARDADEAYRRWDDSHEAPPAPMQGGGDEDRPPGEREADDHGAHELDKQLLLEIEAGAHGLSTGAEPPAPANAPSDQQSAREVIRGPHARTWLIPGVASSQEVAASRTGGTEVRPPFGLVLTWGDPAVAPDHAFGTTAVGLPRWPGRADELFDCLDDRFGGFGGVGRGLLADVQPDEDRRFAAWIGVGMDGRPLAAGTTEGIDAMADRPDETMRPLGPDDDVPAGDLVVYPNSTGPNRVATSFGDGSAGTFHDGAWIRFPIRWNREQPAFTAPFPLGPLPQIDETAARGCLNQTAAYVLIGLVVAAALVGGIFFLVGGDDDTVDDVAPPVTPSSPESSGGTTVSDPADQIDAASGTDVGGTEPCSEILEVEVVEIDGRTRVRISVAATDPPLEDVWEDKFSIAFAVQVRVPPGGEIRRFLWESHDGGFVDGLEVDATGTPVAGAEAAEVTVSGNEVTFDLPDGTNVDAVQVEGYSRPSVDPGIPPPPGPQFADIVGPFDI